MENGETTDEGAIRETLEEAGARVELRGLYSVIDVPHVDQIHLFFRARLLNTDFDPGTESLEVKLFDEADIPWNDIAFRTVAQTLRWYFEDRASPAPGFNLHTSSLRFERKP